MSSDFSDTSWKTRPRTPRRRAKCTEGQNDSHKHIAHQFLSHNGRSHYHREFHPARLRTVHHAAGKFLLIKSGLGQNCMNLQSVLQKENTKLSFHLILFFFLPLSSGSVIHFSLFVFLSLQKKQSHCMQPSDMITDTFSIAAL